MIFTDTHFHLCEDIALSDYITEAQKEQKDQKKRRNGDLSSDHIVLIPLPSEDKRQEIRNDHHDIVWNHSILSKK